MSIVDPTRYVESGVVDEPETDATPAKPSGWANSGPLCLIAFAVVTFMFSLVNAEGVSSAVVPVIISTGLIFGGTTQLIGGLIQIRTGDTLNGALFATFGAFWIVLPAYLEWFSKAVPAAQVGHATGLLLYTFAIVAAMFLFGLLPHHDRYGTRADQPPRDIALAGRRQLRRPHDPDAYRRHHRSRPRRPGVVPSGRGDLPVHLRASRDSSRAARKVI